MLFQEWADARNSYNAGRNADDPTLAPADIPYEQLLRDYGGLPKKLPTSGSFPAALFFLRVVLEFVQGPMAPAQDGVLPGPAASQLPDLVVTTNANVAENIVAAADGMVC
jgi:hypothetical protein